METFRWARSGRHLVLVAELLLAGTFVFLGHQLLAGDQPSPAPTVSRHAPVVAPAVGSGAIAIPRAQGATASPTPVLTSILALGSDPAVLDRLNHDDLLLYRRQWQVLGLLMAGIRQYLEHRVVPSLLAH